MSDHERHKGCGGYVYANHQGDEWYLFCLKCGKRTKSYNYYSKAKKAWYEMVEPIAESKEE